MARGWESKAVESQIEAAETRSSRLKGSPVTAEQVKIQRERESIELSRTRVLRDMAAATNPKYRDLLQRSLEFLDTKLKALDGSNKPGLRG